MPCVCPVNGTEKCECEIKARGYVTEPGTGEQVLIYQSVGVTDEQAVAATTNIIAGFENLVIGYKVALEGKLKEIRIVESATISDFYEVNNGKIILKMPYNLPNNDITSTLSYFVNNVLPGLTLSRAPVRNTVRLASVPAKRYVAPALQLGKGNALRLQNRAAMESRTLRS